MQLLISKSTLSVFLFLFGISMLDLNQSIASNGGNIDIDEKLQKAEHFYGQRESLAKLKFAVQEYKSALVQIQKQKLPDNKKRAEIFIELSKCYFKMAAYHTKDGDEKTQWFTRGEEFGRRAMALDPNNIGGYYWMAQNLGKHGAISKLYFLSRKKDFEEALKIAKTLDDPENPYDYSGVSRTLAAYYTPRFMWGDLEKAMKYAETIEEYPRYLDNLSVLAELYWNIDKEKSLEYVKQVIEMDTSQYPNIQLENSDVQKEVEKKWSRQLD